MDELDEVVDEFLVESFENLDHVDSDLLALERRAGDIEAIASIFRAMHTMKGTCGFLGFTRLERVTHVAEGLLGQLRDGELRFDSEVAATLLATTDALRAMLLAVESTGVDGDQDPAGLIARLEALRKRADDQRSTARLGELLVASGVADARTIDAAAARQLLDGDERRLGEILVNSGAVDAVAVVEALERQEAPEAIANGSIRIDVGALDHLANLVAELVSSGEELAQLAGAVDDGALRAVAQRVNHLGSQVEQHVMTLRNRPIGTVWAKLPRVVRDLALRCGKQVRVEMDGQDTLVDKTIIEAIKDPLTHLVRNAVDHGVEVPHARIAAGKPAEARLFLRAWSDVGHVSIEVADDGRGIDAGTLRAKAVERGILTPEDAEGMGEEEALALVFAAGLSSAPAVTNVSGRGVGMDVVLTNIGRIGGTVELRTERGRGTTVAIRIPLDDAAVVATRADAQALGDGTANGTLAEFPVSLLVADLGDEHRVAIPLAPVDRLEELALGSIRPLPTGSVTEYRGQTLALVALSEALGVGHLDDSRETVDMVVHTRSGRRVGLMVGRIVDIVDPLDGELSLRPGSARHGVTGVTELQGHITDIVDVETILIGFAGASTP